MQMQETRSRWTGSHVAALVVVCSLTALFLLSSAAASALAAGPEETWDAFYVDDAKIGYAHTVTSDIEDNGRKLRQMENVSQMTINRLGQPMTIDMKTLNLAAADTGNLLRFATTFKLAGTAMAATGTVKNGKLAVEAQMLGQPQKLTIDFPPGTGGFDAVEKSLAAKPMQPGETRKLKMLQPTLGAVALADVTLKAGELEDTKLLGGKTARLLKIQSESAAPGMPVVKATSWCDDKGTALKAVQNAGIDFTAYRTTREVAMGEGGGSKPDLIGLSIVKISPPPKDLHGVREVVYRATLTDEDPAKVFPTGLSQSVKSLGEHEAEITVQAIRPDSPAPAAKLAPPADGDRKPNGMIQSDDARVVAMAKAAATKETDPWKIAVALERHVRDSMTSADFTQALTSAAEVCRTRKGDCTEFAVLLAALARARGIPARVAVGLVYVPTLGGFGFHMWTEVWIKDRWIALDATRAQRGIGGGHLKLADTNLADGDPMSLLPVYQVMGKLKVRVISEK